MSRIKFNQAKYVIPIILLPFILLFFWVYRLNGAETAPVKKESEGMRGEIGNASPEVQKRAFDDKLDAFTEQYREADGNTAVNPIQDEAQQDAIDKLMKQRFMSSGLSPGLSAQPTGNAGSQDQELARAMAALQKRNTAGSYQSPNSYVNYGVPSPATAAPLGKEKDPMELFKAQMAYMDSIQKAADPEYKAEQQRQQAVDKAEKARKDMPKLTVQKESQYSAVFNTVKPEQPDNLITAVIDENLTGYAGSRIRLRLLEDIRAGKVLVKKGTYLYALITGFSDQRVTLSVKSILQDGKILPVKLELYDTDGLPGLYVPESAFREFSKDLGANSMQGVNLQGNSTSSNQFLMSSLDKMFQSTSTAIASLIRKNKVSIKYNSYIYLIDPEELQQAQQVY